MCPYIPVISEWYIKIRKQKESNVQSSIVKNRGLHFHIFMFFPKKRGLPTCKVEEFPSIGINEQLCKFMRDYQKDEHLGKDFSILKSIHVKIIPLLKKKRN